METPYVPEHWQNLSLEFTDEYKLMQKKKMMRNIEKLNVSKSPKIMKKAPRRSDNVPKIMDKAPRRSVNDLKKPPEKYEYKYEPSECYNKRPHCVIL